MKKQQKLNKTQWKKKRPLCFFNLLRGAGFGWIRFRFCCVLFNFQCALCDFAVLFYLLVFSSSFFSAVHLTSQSHCAYFYFLFSQIKR